jgi:hypothetical protein
MSGTSHGTPGVDARVSDNGERSKASPRRSAHRLWWDSPGKRIAANEDGFGTDDGRRAEAGHERALMDA